MQEEEQEEATWSGEAGQISGSLGGAEGANWGTRGGLEGGTWENLGALGLEAPPPFAPFLGIIHSWR